MGRQRKTGNPDDLTPREREVLELVREGLTNPQISERLNISLETAKHHVSEVLSKTGVSSREETAAWAARRRVRWTPIGIALAVASAAAVAAALVGLILLAWGVWQTGDNSTAPSQSLTPAPGQGTPAQDYGPLTVLEGPGGGPQARGGRGPLSITATCVTMTRENGDTVLLVWQSADVTWDGTTREITFVQSGGLAGEAPITLDDGDTITIGGAALDNLPGETQLDWLATPQPGCDGERWFVSGVIKG